MNEYYCNAEILRKKKKRNVWKEVKFLKEKKLQQN